MGTTKRGRPKKFDPSTAQGSRPPSSPAVYRIVDRETGKVEYAGDTNNAVRRAIEHARSGKLDPGKHDFEWKDADGRSTSDTRREVERKWIEKHQPPLNLRSGGGGRKAKLGSAQKGS